MGMKRLDIKMQFLYKKGYIKQELKQFVDCGFEVSLFWLARYGLL